MWKKRIVRQLESFRRLENVRHPDNPEDEYVVVLVKFSS